MSGATCGRFEPRNLGTARFLSGLPKLRGFCDDGNRVNTRIMQVSSLPKHCLMNKSRLLERFLRYVRIDTTACEDSGRYPSSDGQLELGRLLVAELQEIGLTDAAQDEHGIVTATIPSTIDGPTPVIAFCSHLDTSPETSGTNVEASGDRELHGRRCLLARRSR